MASTPTLLKPIQRRCASTVWRAVALTLGRWGSATASACLALLIAIGLPFSAHAEWNQAKDEANRQRMMNSMRASAAASDRRSAESLARSQQSYERNRGTVARAPTATRPPGGSTVTGSRPPGGDADAGVTRSVGLSEEFTVYVQETEPQTIERVTREARAGSMQSQFNLGRILFAGYGTPRDDRGARLWFGEAAKQGHVLAQAQYGSMLYNGQGGPVDLVNGLAFVRQAAAAGDAYAQALDGFFTLQQLNGKPAADLSGAIQQLSAAAERGEMLAQATLGSVVYLYGVGAERDLTRAARYLQAAANQQDRGSMATLAQFHMTGAGGVPKDEARALALFRSAAELGDASAQAIYGVFLVEGRKLPQDLVQGLRLAQSSAAAGDVNGQVLLARCHYFGLGTPKNLAEAARWFRKAAEQGCQECADNLKQPDLAQATRAS